MTASDIARMTPGERLDLIGELWDSLSSEDISLTAAQNAELARRMTRFETDRKGALPFDDIEAELDRIAR